MISLCTEAVGVLASPKELDLSGFVMSGFTTTFGFGFSTFSTFSDFSTFSTGGLGSGTGVLVTCQKFH
jgi:hypothetical protein